MNRIFLPKNCWNRSEENKKAELPQIKNFMMFSEMKSIQKRFEETNLKNETGVFFFWMNKDLPEYVKMEIRFL